MTVKRSVGRRLQVEKVRADAEEDGEYEEKTTPAGCSTEMVESTRTRKNDAGEVNSAMIVLMNCRRKLCGKMEEEVLEKYTR